ncbi:iron complex transport system permease protein [Paenibacillus rhizosphaerae]|uniref:Iron complex transport system permease protein n=1 Tax=Paenibacillus rhizosphaerae TaxID=297318 RepID=A0A839TPI5_9BACL|nr:iron ABC transporter permease [Paenibacillus rhizosphaerae]MBB3128622.1 iron complex transport system permease protein [Paenibacillus rhizosphaerae]
MKSYRFVIVAVTLTALLAAAAVLSLRLGAVATPVQDVVQGLLSGDGLIWKYRLPRLIIAVLVGTNLALSGAILQGITRNPLAAPDIVGVSGGAGFAAVLVLLVFPALMSSALPVTAFMGAILAAALVYLIAYRPGGIEPSRLALTGVAISAGFQAMIMLLIVKYALDSSQALVWLKGSLYARTWKHVELLWPWTLVGLGLSLLCRRQFNALQLDEDTVKGLGIRVQLVRLVLLCTAVGLAASAVAIAGTIGFVGLVVPPLSKLLVGPDSSHFLPISALLGALLVTLADMLGRIILPPLEIPAGLVTALIGAPYFIYVLSFRRPKSN